MTHSKEQAGARVKELIEIQAKSHVEAWVKAEMVAEPEDISEAKIETIVKDAIREYLAEANSSAFALMDDGAENYFKLIAEVEAKAYFGVINQ